MEATLIKPTSNQSLNVFIESLIIGVILTVGSMWIALEFGWIQAENFNLLEIFATFTSYSCTYMCVKQTRWNYPMAVVSTAALSLMYWQSGLFASMALNLYLIPTVIYGYFIWGKDKETRPVQHVKLGALYQYAFWTAVAYVSTWSLATYLGGNFAPLDSFMFIGSAFAQFLLDRKKIETWFVWIAVNIVSIYVLFNSGLYLLAIQFLFFLMNAVYGYAQWRKTLVTDEKV